MATYNLDIDIKSKIGQTKAQLTGVTNNLKSMKKLIGEVSDSFEKLGSNTQSIQNLSKATKTATKDITKLANTLVDIKNTAIGLRTVSKNIDSISKSVKGLENLKEISNSFKTMGNSATNLTKINNTLVSMSKNVDSLDRITVSVRNSSKSFELLNNQLSQIGKHATTIQTLNTSVSKLEATLKSLKDVNSLVNSLNKLKQSGLSVEEIVNALRNLNTASASAESGLVRVSTAMTRVNQASRESTQGIQLMNNALGTSQYEDINAKIKMLVDMLFKARFAYKALGDGTSQAVPHLNAIDVTTTQSVQSFRRLNKESSLLNKALTKFKGMNFKGLIKDSNKLRDSFSDLQQIVKGIIISQVFYQGIGAVKEFTSAVWESYKSVEQLKSGLDMLWVGTENEGKSQAMADYADQLTAMTGIETKMIHKSMRNYAALGYSAEQTQAILQSTANAVAFSGDVQNFQSIAIALQQIKTNGKLMGQEVMQLANAGVQAKRYLKEALNLTDKQVQNLGKLNIKSDVAISAILQGLNKDFGNGMKVMNETTQGALNQIKSNFLLIFRDIYSDTMEQLSGFIKGFRDVMLVLYEVQTKASGGLKMAFLNILPPELVQSLAVLKAWLGQIWNAIVSIIPSVLQLGYSFMILYSNVMSGVAPVFLYFIQLLGNLMQWLAQTRWGVVALAYAFISYKSVGVAIKAFQLFQGVLASTNFTALASIWNIRRLTIETALAGGGVIGTIKAVTGAFTASLAVLAGNPLFWALLGGLAIGGAITLGGMALAKKGETNIGGDIQAELDKLKDAMSKSQKDLDKMFNPELGKTTDNANKTAQSVNLATDALNNFGDEADEAANKAKKASSKLLSFDEIFQLVEDTEKETEGLGDFDLGDFEMPDLGSPNVDLAGFKDKLGGLTTAFDDWKGNMQTQGGFWEGIFAGLKGTLKDIYTLLIGFPLDTLMSINKIMLEVGKGVAKVIGNSIQWVGQQIAIWGSAISTTLIQTLGSFATWVGSMLGHLGRFIGESLFSIGKWSLDTLGIWSNWATESLKSIGMFVGGALLDLGRFTLDSATAIFNWATQTGATWIRWGIDSLASITKFTIDAGAEILSWTGETFSNIATWASGTWQNFQTWSTTVGSIISNWAKSTASTLGNWAKDTLLGFGAWVKDSVSHFSNFENWSKEGLSTWASDTGGRLSQWSTDTKTAFGGVATETKNMLSQMDEANNLFVKNMEGTTSTYMSNQDKNTRETYAKISGYGEQTGTDLKGYWNDAWEEQSKTNSTLGNDMVTATNKLYDSVVERAGKLGGELSGAWNTAWQDQIKTNQTMAEELSTALNTAWTGMKTDTSRIWGEWSNEVEKAWKDAKKKSGKVNEEWKTDVSKAFTDMTGNINDIFQKWWKGSAKDFVGIGVGIADALTGGTGKFIEKWNKAFDEVSKKADTFQRNLERNLNTTSRNTSVNVNRNLVAPTGRTLANTVNGATTFSMDTISKSVARVGSPNVNTETVGRTTQESTSKLRNTTTRQDNKPKEEVQPIINNYYTVSGIVPLNQRSMREFARQLEDAKEENNIGGRRINR